jgi:hypothetical protein
MCTDVTHGIDVWPGADVVSHRPKSPRLLWRDWQACSIRRRLSQRNRVNHHGATHPQNIAPLPLPFSSLSLFLPSPLLTLQRLHWRFWVLPQIPSPWCEKSATWIGILIVLGTYIVFTVLFCCILKFSFGWTHVAWIRDAFNVFAISM